MKGYLSENSGLTRPELNPNSVTLAHSSELKPYDSFTESMTQQIYSLPALPEEISGSVQKAYDRIDKRIEGLENDKDYESNLGKLEERKKTIAYNLEKYRQCLSRPIDGLDFKLKDAGDADYLPDVLYETLTSYPDESVTPELVEEFRKGQKPSFWSKHPRLTKVVVGGMALGFMLPLAGCIRPDNPVNPPEPPADKDGLPDDWEMQHFGHLNYTGADDPDADGLTNAQEYGADTNPIQADTDADGYDDYKETRIPGLDPLDSDVDKDGLKDGKDEDGDGMSNWFEGKSDLYDPLVKNDRYVILVDSGWLSTLPEYSLGNFNGQYDFFNKDMDIKAGNIYRINHTEPAWSRFKEAVKDVEGRSDGNDLLFVMLTGHGGSKTFTFNTELNSSWVDEPRQVSYEDINRELNKIQTKAQYIQINACSSESSIEHLEDTHIPRIIVADTNKSACGASFDFIQSIYPAAMSGKIKVFYRHPANESWLKAKWVDVESDKDKNGFVSMEEAFNTARDVYFLDNHPDIPEELRIRHLYPHISDAKKIAGKLYFGDYPVED